MSEARALTNLIGIGVATVVVARWEGELDMLRMHAELDGRDYIAKPDPHGTSIKHQTLAWPSDWAVLWAATSGAASREAN